MFQVSFGMSAFESGLLVLAMFAGNLSMKPVTTPVLRRFGFRQVLLANGAITAVLFLHGLSRSMQFIGLSTLAFVDIPKALMSSAPGFSAVVIQMSMGMGIAVGALALRLAARMLGYETHAHETTAPALMDFRIAFGLVSILALVAILDCLALDPRAGSEVKGYWRP